MNHPHLNHPERDQIFQGATYPRPFRFNDEVAHVFDDMVMRSIPMYADVTDLAAKWALWFYQKGSSIYDIGCSTGTGLFSLGQSLESPAHFIGIDSAAPMINKARAKLSRFPQRHSLKLVCGDVMDQEFSGASIVIINYTLQFLPVEIRRKLIGKIFADLLPGGILFMSEKVKARNIEFQQISAALYEEFKTKKGYSQHEIARKKEALENVLIPFSEAEYVFEMARVGFSSPEIIAKWHNFSTIVAQKPRNA